MLTLVDFFPVPTIEDFTNTRIKAIAGVNIKKRFSGEQIINVSDRPFFQPDSLLETTSIANF